ncbi:uncharacterized protein [Onthophagus taurus]|uniref:uncharacterized protein n=1 Tax=Onthophagus taurus TaxID=166361 RepID=UPI0039BE1EEC
MIFQLNKVLEAGCFIARKWVSNNSEALNYLHPELLSQSSLHSVEEDNCPRALGLLWNNFEDQFLFICRASYNSSKTTTKREVLSFIARLFDPLGWLPPLIITAKILMQELWVRHLDWDETLPQDLENK